MNRSTEARRPTVTHYLVSLRIVHKPRNPLPKPRSFRRDFTSPLPLRRASDSSIRKVTHHCIVLVHQPLVEPCTPVKCGYPAGVLLRHASPFILPNLPAPNQPPPNLQGSLPEYLARSPTVSEFHPCVSILTCLSRPSSLLYSANSTDRDGRRRRAGGDGSGRPVEARERCCIGVDAYWRESA